MPLLDHDHDTYGRLLESGIGGCIYVYRVIVPRMGVGVGDIPKVLINWIAHDSPLEQLQANTEEGILYWNVKKEKPLGGSDQGHGHGSWKEMDFGYPQLFR